MRIAGGIAALILLCGCASTETPRFGPRPRLAFTQADLDAWQPGRIRQTLARTDAILKRGVTVSDKEGQWIFYYACPDDNARLKPESPERHVCPTCGKVYTDERTLAAYQTVLHYQLDSDLYDLALAWAVSRNDTYAGPVRQAFLDLTRIYPTLVRHDRWGRRGILAIVGGRRYCQHLDEAVSVIKLARAYDLVASSPVFTDDDRHRIERDFLARICYEIQGKAWLMEPQNNHQTWFNAAYANVGVAIGDAGLLEDAIHGSSSGLLWQLEHSVTDDGIWYEGTMAYHFYALSAIIDTLEAAGRAGWDFADNARLKSLWLGPLQMAYPDGRFPVINDSDPADLRGRKSFYQFARTYFDDPRFDAFDQLRALPSATLEGAGLVALRRGAGGNARCTFLDYGIHGGHHGHPDKLNITLYTFGEEIVPDPGRISYSVPEYTTWARTSVAHNTIVINQRSQQPTEGRLLWFADTPEYAATVAETTGAYPGYTLRRGLVLTDRWLLDIVTVDGDTPATIDLLLHARNQLRETGEPVGEPLGKSDGYQHLTEVVRQPDDRTTFHFLHGKQTLAVHTWPRTPAWSGIGIGYRLNDKVPFLLRRQEAAHGAFVTLYDLAECGAELKEVQADGSRFRVVLQDGATTHKVTLDTAAEATERMQWE